MTGVSAAVRRYAEFARTRRVSGSAATLLLVLAAVWPVVFNNDYYANVGVVALLYVLLGLGMDVLLGYGGLLHAGFAAFYGAGAYGIAYALLNWGWSFWITLPVAVIVSALLAVVIGIPGLRVSGLYYVLMTLAAGELFTITMNNVDAFGGANGLFGLPSASIAGHEIFSQRDFYWMLLPFVVVALVIVRAIATSRIGLSWNCGRIDEVAAKAIGINVFRARLQLTALAGALAGLAGAFFAIHQSAVSPESFSFSVSITIVLVVALGGLRSVAGLLVGVALIAVLPEVLRSFHQYSLFAYGLAIVLVIQFRPDGLLPGRGRVLSDKDLAVQDLDTDERPSGLPNLDTSACRALSLREIAKAFGGVRAANRVSFDLRAGEIVGLIGPNGAGKTTVLNMISGQVVPDRGTITWGDLRLDDTAAHGRAQARVTRTFQTPRLFDELSVVENLVAANAPNWHTRALGAVCRTGAARRERREAVGNALEVLRFVDPALAERANDRIGSLSYGMLRKLEIARALVPGPGLLLLDEPAAGLNGAETAQLGDLLLRISDLGVAVLLVEHDMELVMGVTDRIVVLDHGEVIATGSPDEIAANPVVIESYLGADDDEQINATERVVWDDQVSSLD